MRTKGKKIELDQKSQEWLDWRNDGVGASESAIIKMEENYPYSSNVQKLWAVKTGVLEPEIISNKFTERGNELEPVAREEFIRRTGIYIKPMCFEHSFYPFIKASMDGITEDEEVICEIKCPSKPERHQAAIEGRIPEEYYTQMQHQFLVTGASVGYFVSYFPNYYQGDENLDLDFKMIKVEPNYAFIEDLQRKLVRFWKFVEERNLPTEDALSETLTRGATNAVGLVMISGYAKAGKDELGKAFQRIYKANRYAFADHLKEVYIRIAGITHPELLRDKEIHRPSLVELGAGMRAVYPDVWLKGLFKDETGIYESMKGFGAFISDVRYINEFTYGMLEAKKREVNYKTIWIDASSRGVVPANEEEVMTTSLLREVADVIFYSDVVIEDERHLEAAMNTVLLRIYQGYKEIRLSEIAGGGKCQ